MGGKPQTGFQVNAKNRGNVPVFYCRLGAETVEICRRKRFFTAGESD